MLENVELALGQRLDSETRLELACGVELADETLGGAGVGQPRMGFDGGDGEVAADGDRVM